MATKRIPLEEQAAALLAAASTDTAPPKSGRTGGLEAFTALVGVLLLVVVAMLVPVAGVAQGGLAVYTAQSDVRGNTSATSCFSPTASIVSVADSYVKNDQAAFNLGTETTMLRLCGYFTEVLQDLRDAEVDDETSAAPSLGEGVGTETSASVLGPAPMPTVAPHYAVPIDAAPVTRLGPRQNAAPLVQVWSGPSLKPIPIQDSGGIPPEQLAVMQQVGQETAIAWQIFAAIAKVESDHGRNMSTSWAGAIGYGQFLPETWVDYGNGGDPYDFRDVIPAMGRYLLVAGVLDDLPQAIYAYNHSWSYVSLVLSYAAAYGYQATN